MTEAVKDVQGTDDAAGPVCEGCKNFFPIEENPSRGDCVLRQTDARQSFYSAREVNADADASGCQEFIKRANS